MKAAADQQSVLGDLVDVDAELMRIAHRKSRLLEDEQYQELQQRATDADDRLGALRLALEDLNAEVEKFEHEIEAVRKREDRDQSLLDSGSPNVKQLTDLQHEMETLKTRQRNLEDSLLEVMERREQLQTQEAEELAIIEGLQTELAVAQRTRDATLDEIECSQADHAQRRADLLSRLEPELAALYEQQLAAAGVGAGVLQGRRCGACRIELDRGELARISAAADDEVLRCPECRAILLRVGGAGA